jgi:hypothetical protein
METIDPSVFIVIGITLFFVLFLFIFRYFLKRRKKKRQLKEDVVIALTCIKADEQERMNLWLTYQLILSKIDYKPEKIHETLTKLNYPVEIGAKEMIDLFSPKPRGFWKLLANSIYYESLIPEWFNKPLRLSIKNMESILIQFQKLASRQSELIGILRDKTSEKFYSKNEEGESILISAIEWYSKVEVAKDTKEEGELAEAMLKAEVDGAKDMLGKAIKYANTRQSSKSLEVGEKSIIAGTRHLNFKEVKKYCKEALEKVAKLEAEGSKPSSITDFCITASLDLKQNFEDWAKNIFDRQFSYDGIQAYQKELGESQNIEIVATEEMANQVFNLFQDIIPKNWGNAKWGSLSENLEEVDEILEKMEILVKELEYWAQEITNLEIRIQVVLDKEKYLIEHYGKTEAPTPSKEWLNALASWKNDVPDLLAKGLQDELEKTLDSLETPLVQHSYKVGNRLDEAEKLAGVITPTDTVEAVFEKPSSRFSTTGNNARKGVDTERTERLPEKPKRSLKPPSFEPEKKLSGTMVKVIAHGIEIEVDSSLANLYEKVDPAPKKEKKKK